MPIVPLLFEILALALDIFVTVKVEIHSRRTKERRNDVY